MNITKKINNNFMSYYIIKYDGFIHHDTYDVMNRLLCEYDISNAREEDFSNILKIHDFKR